MDDENEDCLLGCFEITPPPSPDRSRRAQKLNLSEEAFRVQMEGWTPKESEGTWREKAERAYYLRDWEAAEEAVVRSLAEDDLGAVERGEVERIGTRARERAGVKK